ncbi:MAG: glycosyltransferase [Candidatus Micrarchaeia archaeon]
MKLLIIQPYLNLRGGAERVILSIARHYDAKIYTTEYNKRTTFQEFRDFDIKVVKKHIPLSDKLPYRASQGLRYGYTFYNLALKEDYDLINAHISPSEWIRHKNKRVLWYCHTPPREVYDLYSERMKNRNYTEKFVYATFTRAYKFITEGIIKEIEGIATNSENTASRIKKYFNRDAEIINPAVDFENFSNKGDEKYFFYPSRIIPNKRQEYAINAFKKFEKKKEGYKLIIAGTLSNDIEHIKYFEKLKKMADSRIEFKINIGDAKLKELYAGSTAVLFTAINEDYGYIPLEAMASSKPIISVNEGGPRETIINGKTGFITNSEEEMAEKMLFVAEHPDTAEKMGKLGRENVEKNYSWNMFFKKFDRLANQIAKSD